MQRFQGHGQLTYDSGMIPPTVYYARVGLELGKIVFHGQKMAPP